MIPFVTLLLAVLADADWDYNRHQRLRELYTRLGLGVAPYKGMALPTVGELVMSFADGAKIVRLRTPEDFVLVGESMDNLFLGGERGWSGGPRAGNGNAQKASEAGRMAVFALMDSDGVPEAAFTVVRKHPFRDDEDPVLELGSYHRPNLILADWLPEHWRHGIPERLQDRLLAFWLDIVDLVDHEPDILAAWALLPPGEDHPGPEWEGLKRSWFYDIDTHQTQDWMRRHSTLTYLDDHGNLFDSDNEDFQEFEDVSEAFETQQAEVEEKAMGAAEGLGRLPPFEVVQMATDIESSLDGQRVTMRWQISDRRTGEFLLGHHIATLTLVRFRPTEAWMQQHRVRDPDNPYDMRLEFDEPIFYWRLEHLSGRQLGEPVPYHEGPWKLFEEHLDIVPFIESARADLLEDAAVVLEETDRTWHIPPHVALSTEI